MTNLNAVVGLPAGDARFGLDELTADAQDVLRKLSANDAEHVDLALEFGSLIAKAKETLPHGEF